MKLVWGTGGKRTLLRSANQRGTCSPEPLRTNRLRLDRNLVRDLHGCIFVYDCEQVVGCIYMTVGEW